MSVLSTVAATAYGNRAQWHPTLRQPRPRKAQKSSGFRVSGTYGHCIKDNVLIEPACGNGNFLAEILRRKLAAVEARYRKSPADYEKYAVMAVTSLYGVDILQDNVEECRDRLFAIWNDAYEAHMRGECREECREAVRYILTRNILCGNALTLRQVDASGEDTGEPILFSEWVFTGRSSVKRRDYRLDVLMERDRKAQAQISMFSEETTREEDWMRDPEDPRWRIPRPLREYAPVYYWKVQQEGRI